MSIEITNFSIAAGEWGYADSGVSVDIIDSVYNVTTSGCYLEIDGTTVSSTLTSISGGYRLGYDQLDSWIGPVEFTVYGSNDNLDLIYENFYLTFGYIVEYVNRPQGGWDFGYDTEVVVRASAENVASCPIKSAEAFLFETESRPQKHLGASIVGVPAKESVTSDMSASIYPQSTAFFYGKTYKVVLRAKDFAGNEMEPFEFEFKIEDAPE